MTENNDICRVSGIDGSELKSFVERVERLNDDISGFQDDRTAVFAEAKARGFDPSILKKIIRIRKRDKSELDEEQTLLEIYQRALGMDIHLNP